MDHFEALQERLDRALNKKEHASNQHECWLATVIVDAILTLLLLAIYGIDHWVAIFILATAISPFLASVLLVIIHRDYIP